MQTKQVIEILKNKKIILSSIEAKRSMIYDDLLIYENQLKKYDLPERRIIQDKILSLQTELKSLASEEEIILSVHKALYKLEYEKFVILSELYIKNKTWVCVEKDMGISHETLKVKRKDALENLMSLMPGDEHCVWKKESLSVPV